MTFTHIKITPVAGDLADVANPDSHYNKLVAAQTKLTAYAPELLFALKNATFLLESVAHLRGMEAELLPTVKEYKEFIASFKQEEEKGKGN